MDLVTSFFENILTVESESAGAGGSDHVPSQPSAETSESTGGNPVPSKRDSFDFNFWKKEAATSQNSANAAPSAASTLYNIVQAVGSGSVSNVAAAAVTGTSGSKGPGSQSGNVLTDKLMEKIISMILPLDHNSQHGQVLTERAVMQKSRPPLSVNIMSTNSIQLNQRLSVVFELLDDVIRFFDWEKPVFTISLLFIATHIILKPILLTVVPLAYLLLNVMVPHYLVVYPPDKSIIPLNPIPAECRLARAKVPQPIPEFSREFILNLTDLQNYMVIYVVAYDLFTWLTRDYLYFKHEDLLSMIFLVILGTIAYNLVVLPRILPWIVRYLPAKLILISLIWIITILFHPYFRNMMLEWFYAEDTRLWWVSKTDMIEMSIRKYLAIDYNFGTSESLNEKPDVSLMETREVEIFELQYFNVKTNYWEKVGFTTDFYTVNNPYRILNKGLFEGAETEALDEIHYSSEDVDSEDEFEEPPPSDSSFFHEELDEREYKIPRTTDIKLVMPPLDWSFSQSCWKLSLDSEWVYNNLIQDVVTVDTDEKWVYDVIPPDMETGAETSSKSEIYRRRRWIRKCVRQSTLDSTETKEEKESGPSLSFANYLI